jgi:predicted SprT family Zn-dependent metalloprotease
MSKHVHVSDELKLMVEYKLLECMKIADKLTDNFPEFEMPAVTYDVSGRCAGKACDYDYSIELNPVLLNENREVFINRTVVHEFAHLVDGILHPWTRDTRRGRSKKSYHGRTWKWVMVQLGADPSRTHSYDISNAATKTKHKYRYICTLCKKDIIHGPVKHKRQQSGESNYGHRRCNWAPIEYIEPLGQVTYQEAHAGKKKTGGMGYYAPVPKKKKPRAETKINKAVMILKIYNSLNTLVEKRQEIIEVIMDELDMTKAGATTYYYSARKKL